MSKKMKIILAISVLLNMLFIGLVIGHMTHRHKPGEFMRRRTMRLARTLSPEKRTLFMGTLEKVYRDNEGIHEKIREGRKRIVSILSAPDFDENAYQEEVEKIHRLRGMMMQRLADATKELAKKFTPEERKALAAHLLKPPHPMFGKKALHHGTLPYKGKK